MGGNRLRKMTELKTLEYRCIRTNVNGKQCKRKQDKHVFYSTNKGYCSYHHRLHPVGHIVIKSSYEVNGVE